MTTLFGRPFLHRHFQRRTGRDEASPRVDNGDMRSFATLRSTSKGRTYRVMRGATPTVVKRFFDHRGFVSELLIHELMKGHSAIPAVQSVSANRARIVMQCISTTRPADRPEDFEFLFHMLGMIHGRWEKAWRAGGLAETPSYSSRSPSLLSDQECRIVRAFDAIIANGYPAISVGDVKLEHVLVSGRDQFLIDFDTAEIGRFDATDLVLGLVYCPAAFTPYARRYIRFYDDARASTGSGIEALADLASDIVFMADQCRSSVEKAVEEAID